MSVALGWTQSSTWRLWEVSSFLVPHGSFQNNIVCITFSYTVKIHLKIPGLLKILALFIDFIFFNLSTPNGYLIHVYCSWPCIKSTRINGKRQNPYHFYVHRLGVWHLPICTVTCLKAGRFLDGIKWITWHLYHCATQQAQQLQILLFAG